MATPTPLLDKIKADVAATIKDEAVKIAVKTASDVAAIEINKIKQEVFSMEKIAWYKQKTTWTAIAGVIASVGGLLTGTMDPGTAIQTAIGSVTAIFLRQGIEKAKTN